MYRDLVYQSLASIGTQHRFNIDLIAGAGFGHVCTSGLQAGPTTIPLQIKIQLYATDIGHRVRVIIDATETVAERKRSQHRGRLSAIGNREHVFYAHVRIAIDADASA